MVRPIDVILSDHIDDFDPPLRGINGGLVRIEERRLSSLHELADQTAKRDDNGGSLPAPALPLITQLSTTGIALLVENYVAAEAPSPGRLRDVALSHPFCQALDELTPSRIPTVQGVQVLPLVLHDRSVVLTTGYDQDLRLMMRLDPSLVSVLPRDAITVERATKAFRWLCDQWLVDVETDIAGKAVLVAAACSIIERHLFAGTTRFHRQCRTAWWRQINRAQHGRRGRNG